MDTHSVNTNATAQTRAEPGSSRLFASLGKSNLHTMVSIALCIIAFVPAALSWHRYFLENNGPVGLFTQTDFPAIVIASRLVSSGHGAELYDFDLQLQEQNNLLKEGSIVLTPAESAQIRYPYPYTPFLAVLWSPFTWLPPRTAMAIWDLVNIAVLSLGLCYLLTSLPLPRVTRWLVLLATITCFPFITNLEQGQSSGVVLLGFAVGIALLRRGRDLPAGVALALLVFKVQWLPFMVLILLWQRRWKTLLSMAATTLALLLGIVLTIGTGWVPGFLDVISKAQAWSHQLLLEPWYSHSLSGGLAALLGPNTEKTISTINTAVTFLVAALLLVIWSGKWRPGTPSWDAAMAVVVLATMLTNLQVNTHDLCLLSIPAALGISYIYQSKQSNGAKMAWYALIWAVYLLTSNLPIPTHGLSGPMDTLFGLAFSLPVRLITLMIGLTLGFLAWSLLRPLQIKETQS